MSQSKTINTLMNMGHEMREEYGVKIFTMEFEGKFLLRTLTGRQSKIRNNYSFTSAEKREDYIQETVLASAKAKQQYKAELKALGNQLKVGNILVSTWGYEQTNVDFYKVINLVGSTMVEIVKVSSKLVKHTGHDSGDMVAVPDLVIGEPMKKKVRNGNRISLNSFASASLWDGEPVGATWYY